VTLSLDKNSYRQLQEITFWQKLNKQIIALRGSGASITDSAPKKFQKFCLEQRCFYQITQDPLIDDIPLTLITDFNEIQFLTNGLPKWCEDTADQRLNYPHSARKSHHIRSVNWKAGHGPAGLIDQLRLVMDFDRRLADEMAEPVDGPLECLDQLQIAAGRYDRLDDFLEYADSVRTNGGADENGVTLSTVHKAKGLEFAAVFVMGMVEGIMPHREWGH
jgi:hypothetical protein